MSCGFLLSAKVDAQFVFNLSLLNEYLFSMAGVVAEPSGMKSWLSATPKIDETAFFELALFPCLSVEKFLRFHDVLHDVDEHATRNSARLTFIAAVNCSDM